MERRARGGGARGGLRLLPAHRAARQRAHPGVRSDVAIKVYRRGPGRAGRGQGEVARAVAARPRRRRRQGRAGVGASGRDGKVDRRAVARYGASAGEVLTAVETLGGKQAGLVLRGREALRAPGAVPAPSVRNDAAAIARVPCDAGGRLVPLGELASFATGRRRCPGQSREHPAPAHRRDQRPWPRHRVGFVRRRCASIAGRSSCRPGYSVRVGRSVREPRARVGRLVVVVPLTLLLIFVLLYGTFGAARPALLIFLNVPFAGDGRHPGARRPRNALQHLGGVGFIALFGVALRCRRDERVVL